MKNYLLLFTYFQISGTSKKKGDLISHPSTCYIVLSKYGNLNSIVY